MPEVKPLVPQTLHTALNAALLDVGADAGTLMMIGHNGAGKVLRIRAHFGPPRRNGGQDREFPEGEKSARWRVARGGSSELYFDVHASKNICEHAGQKPHFRSLLCVPIKRDNEVVGVLNADHSKAGRFTKEHRKALERHAEGIANLADDDAVLAVLGEVAERLPGTSPGDDLAKTLKEILDKLRRALGADLMTLYLYDTETDTFQFERPWPILSGKFRVERLMHNAIRKSDWQYTIINQREASWRDDIASEDAMRAPSDKDEGTFVQREGIRSAGAIPLLRPIWHEEDQEPSVVGVMFVNYRQRHAFTDSEKTALLIVSRALAVAMWQLQERRKSIRAQSGLLGRVLSTVHPLLDYFAEHHPNCLLARLCGGEIPAFVLSIDIRRSTELMKEAIIPANFAKFIHDLESALRAIIINEMGIVDKFTGDGILAFFPTCYSGPDAGQRCLQAAERCHDVFRQVYARHKASFGNVLNTGLGIGIDYGDVTVRFHRGELILVGKPVANACRLGDVPAGKTAANNAAAWELSRLRARKVCAITNRSSDISGDLDPYETDFLEPVVREIKHLGEIECFMVRGLPGPPVSGLPECLWAYEGGKYLPVSSDIQFRQ